MWLARELYRYTLLAAFISSLRGSLTDNSVTGDTINKCNSKATYLLPRPSGSLLTHGESFVVDITVEFCSRRNRSTMTFFPCKTINLFKCNLLRFTRDLMRRGGVVALVAGGYRGI